MRKPGNYPVPRFVNTTRSRGVERGKVIIARHPATRQEWLKKAAARVLPTFNGIDANPGRFGATRALDRTRTRSILHPGKGRASCPGMLTLILLVFAFVLFAVAGLGVSTLADPPWRNRLVCFGLACWVLAEIVKGLPAFR